jgi:hypothetical protein
VSTFTFNPRLLADGFFDTGKLHQQYCAPMEIELFEATRLKNLSSVKLTVSSAAPFQF